MKILFNRRYFILFVILFSIEIAIAVFLKDGFIRYTVGDFLVVILMYCFFKSFIKTKSLYIAIATVLTAYIIEFLQLVNILGYLNLSENKWANLILGNHFSIQDLIAYSFGIVVALYLDIGPLHRWFTHSHPHNPEDRHSAL